MKIFDTHVHLGLLSDDRIETLVALKSARMNNVIRFVAITNSISDFDKVYSALKDEDGVYFAIGISPSEADNIPKNWDTQVYERARLQKVIAVGETGLDYYKKFGDKHTQIELFISQIKISNEIKKPLIIHNREAGADIIDILKNKKPTQPIVYHCYSGGLSFATQSFKEFENLFVSFSGNITYKGQKELYESVKNIPIDRIVIESESPFMSPVSHKMSRNKPDYIVEVLDFIAKTKNIDRQELAHKLWENSNKLFRLSDN